ncbi:hypothetical protein DESUT3_06010 [Desulfuromonas versatilis]|uniref:Response regulator receiver protein n=1 Tax=Desulfuromonas versatilis TaxID=2802975 RepID=A0ABN6DUV7_9BACT|nr:response regulator [Desulfuromonas versatilis]BCR03532.1 hypothetical protein DESUT3_06010 [Desulfuromonas versatilis]
MKPRILIAEDNDSIAVALETLLRRQGLATERVDDGVKAMNSVLATPPDLLVLDLKLPGLHGIELLRKLRQDLRHQDLPVIVITGIYKGDKYARAAKALGASAYLEKPFRAAALLDEVHRALKTAAPTAETIDRHLVRAFLARFSGELQLSDGRSERSVYFLDGAPVALVPGFRYGDFGQYLRSRQLLSDAEYAYYSGPGQSRCEAVVHMGCLDYPEMVQAKLDYLSGELLQGFARGPMTATEKPCAAFEAAQPVTINLPQLLYQGYLKHPTHPACQALLQNHLNRYAATGANYHRFINFLSLPAPDKHLLKRFDGNRQLMECLEMKTAHLPLAQTLHALGMLALSEQPAAAQPQPDFPQRTQFNAIEEDANTPPAEPLESFSDLVETAAEAPLVPEASPLPAGGGDQGESAEIRRVFQGLKGKNYYEIFGMNQAKFSFEMLKERYFAFTRQFGPDTMMRLSGVDGRLVEDILATVSTAYNTLSDVVKKERYDELLGSDRIGLGQKGDERFQAQVQAQSGKVFIEMEEWDNAEKALQDACNIAPGNGDYLAHLAWAIYRNPKNAASRAVLEKSRQLLNSALTLERTGKGFAFKGWMLLEAGQDNLAEAEFSKALKLDARLSMARKGLRLLQEKREQQKKGLFRRIFS